MYITLTLFYFKHFFCFNMSCTDINESIAFFAVFSATALLFIQIKLLNYW